MGVLEIRSRRESRQNIGMPQAPNVSTGAVDAAMRDMRSSAMIAGGIRDFGAGLASLGKSIDNIIERNRRRRIDEAVARRQEALSTMNGEANRQTVGDEEAWVSDNIARRDRIDADIQEGMELSTREMEDVKRRMVGFDLTMQNGWNERAEKIGASRQLDTATANMAGSNEAAASRYASSLAWADWDLDVGNLIAANERRERRALTDGEKTAIRGSQALVVWKSMETNQLQHIAEQADEAERLNPGSGAKTWAEAEKAIAGTGKGDDADVASFLPSSTWLVEPTSGRRHNVMADALRGVTDLKELKADFSDRVRKAKNAWIHNKDAREAATQRENFDTLSADLRKTASGLVDTKVAMAKRGELETPDAYDKRIDGMVETNALDAKNGDAFKKSYRQMLDHTDYVIGEAKAGRGVWTTVKGRDGKAMEVFQPDRRGNGKAETDPSFAAKYTLVGRDGKTPYMDDPAKGMEELDFDLRMGNISVPFYNAQMGKMRVFSDTKAKEAFVRIFGASPDIFSDKDVEAYSKRGVDTETKDVYAKNRWWAGNHQIGERDVTWQEDALEKDGGEKIIEPDQQAQIYDIILDLTAQGMDPTKAIEAYISPTIDKWCKTDLEDRINPDRKIGGKSFREWVLESDRFNAGNSPTEREARLRARQKKAYGDVGDDNK